MATSSVSATKPLPNDLQLNIVERVIDLLCEHKDTWEGAPGSGVYFLNNLITDYNAEDWWENTEDHLKSDDLTAETLDELLLEPISEIWEQTVEETENVEVDDLDSDEIARIEEELAENEPADEEAYEEAREEIAENLALEKFWHNVNDAFVEKMKKYRDALKDNIKKNEKNKKIKQKKAQKAATPPEKPKVVFFRDQRRKIIVKVVKKKAP